MKSLLILFVTIYSVSAHAQFDDATVAPLLRPYSLIENSTDNCPKQLVLTAMCNLGELSLRSMSNVDFTFKKFEAINMGRLTKKARVKIIERNSTNFNNNLVLNKKSKSYHKPKSK